MPMRRCFKKKKEAGLVIKTFTGNKKDEAICRVGARQDVRHVVSLGNLFVYHTDVTCVARINSKQRIIRFEPVGVGDTDETWTDDCSMGKYGQHTFSHIKVLSAPPYDEEHEITVDLRV